MVFVVCWHQIFVHVFYITVSVFLFNLHKTLSKSSMLMTLKQIFQFESTPCAHLREIWWGCWQRFVSMPHLFACRDLMYLVSLSRFMLLNATLWLTVLHTFQSNRPNLADWSKRICITLRKCFCSLLTSNWEVNTGRLLYSCTNFT